ncbi:hypothetical protein U27_00876 [Candidatus Vecturithrix granuli]|uniref:DUF2283 domain-containing protein n=1 Tax=Vecturithrix granuli TaxID=1499967 RepID=A0A081C8S3_VECG1|nr:hypothetical protein U27_00876 [Candidatus Vecturithrix granuli]
MKVFYDNEVDALYIQLGQEDPEGVSEMSNGLNVDLTHDGKVVGIEILEASKKLDLQTILVYSLDIDQKQLFRKVA